MVLWIKRIILTIVALASLYGIGRLSVVTYDSYLFLERQPYLQMQTQNSIVIKWQSDASEIGCVIYGENQKVCEDEATSYHHITLTGLTPSTPYMYKVISPSMEIDNDGRYFTTLDNTQPDMQRIWVVGDSGKKGKKQQDVLNSILHVNQDRELDLWILLGDNAYRSGTQEQFNKALFKPYKEQLKTLVPWAVNGNHDARRWAFYNIFEFPEQGESGGAHSGSEEFYAIESGNVHIVMLDSHEGDTSKDGEMAQWLKKDLAQVTKPWIIAAFHHPPYSDGGHKSDNPRDSWGRMERMRENIVPILEEYGVDLVLAGHSHGYERSKLMHKHYGDSKTFDASQHLLSDDDHRYCKNPKRTAFDGAIYNVVGSSSKLDRNTYAHPAMPHSYESLGSLLLHVTPTTLRADFIDDKQTIKDYYIINKSLTCNDEA
ncbi:MAG: metallophosphoesterase [Campylobacterota bacterium]|nr:metallophosphoesterase [Campylobacterota bacterium]